MQLLLIDDGSRGPSLLAQRLASAGFRARRVTSVAHSLVNGAMEGAAVVVIDQQTDSNPSAPAIEQLRTAGMRQPVIVLTARDDWRERVSCIEAGADDVLVKPVHSEEVAARLRAIVRRAAGWGSDRIVFGSLELDLKGRCAWSNGTCLDLTRSEFWLLRMFLLAPERTVTKQEIASVLWPENPEISWNAIEVQMARLRRKVGPEQFKTVRGLGYRIIELPATAQARSEREDCAKGCVTDHAEVLTQPSA